MVVLRYRWCSAVLSDVGFGFFGVLAGAGDPFLAANFGKRQETLVFCMLHPWHCLHYQHYAHPHELACYKHVAGLACRRSWSRRFTKSALLPVTFSFLSLWPMPSAHSRLSRYLKKTNRASPFQGVSQSASACRASSAPSRSVRQAQPGVPQSPS